MSNTPTPPQNPQNKRSTIHTAQLDWQTDDKGIRVPISSKFGDVYFSRSDGLAESRYVFIDGNNLANRLANLGDFERFVIGEIGFGTGLNILAIWQLWQDVRPQNHSHLHIITTEKFPLTKTDLQQALGVWTELMPFAEKLINNYPPPLAGCHRLNFFDERITIDIWLGDATDSLSQVMGHAKVAAWLLDGFAPSCNRALWTDELFRQIARLSHDGTTLATFSVASVVKQGLQQHGFILAKRQGFGKKREMLTAKFLSITTQTAFYNLSFRYNKKIKPYFVTLPFSAAFERKRIRQRKNLKSAKKPFQLPIFTAQQSVCVAIMGAGVAGLTTAYALASRGHHVIIFDKDKPLSGASGNVRAFLAPKLTALSRLPTNLHAIGFLASCRFYPLLAKQANLTILEKTGTVDLLATSRVTAQEVTQMPAKFAQLLTHEEANAKTGYAIGEAIYFPEAGLIHTANFANAVLAHPNIRFQQADLKDYYQANEKVILNFREFSQVVDHVVLCMALETCDFLPHIRRFNYSRGQVSWFKISAKEKNHLPKLPLKYGSYLAHFSDNDEDFAMLGASFIRDTLDTTPAMADHQMNVADLNNNVPNVYADNIELLTPNLDWEGRSRLRSQTIDYLPLVGQVGESNSRVWTFSALGSKGYAYAPIGSELLAGLLCGEILPLSNVMVEKLSPNRKILYR